MSAARVVRGEIELPSDAEAVLPARVVVDVEDISRADAPSQLVARLQLETGELKGSDLIPFSLEVPADALDERHLYSVRVHVDMSGSGEIEKGDYITMQTYPVLTRGYGDKTRVAVRKV